MFTHQGADQSMSCTTLSLTNLLKKKKKKENLIVGMEVLWEKEHLLSV